MTDLSDLRVRLDQMTERILSRLKDRSRFPGNPAVYEPGGVPVEGRSGISLLDFALEGLEIYHASLGRYSYPDQYRLTAAEVNASPVQRTVAAVRDPDVAIQLRDNLLTYYRELVQRLSAPGEDASTYGETAYVDADLLNLLNERINVGRQVAKSKAVSNPSLGDIVNDGEALTALLRDEAREQRLLETVEATAMRYSLDPAIARGVFRWIIDETLALEVAYLQRLAAAGNLGSLTGR
ncbi:MAG: chorismate mutase [Dehalococcoidia bacterium]